MPNPNLPPNQQANAADAIAVQPEKFRAKLQNELLKQGVPNTGNEKLTDALRRHLPILFGTIAIPDDAEEMRWRLFFAHSQDMQGFRADIFTGGPNEADHPTDENYKGLRDRWPSAKALIEGLAALWLNPGGQKTLRAITNPFRPVAEKALGIAPALELLRGPLGNPATRIFADAYEKLKGRKISHKTNVIVRAYCQNAAALAPHDYCFRTYLKSLADPFLPSDGISSAETKWVEGIQRDFYNVGPALAPYLVADWLLYLWLDGQISWFTLYKPDSVFLQNAHAYLPPEATENEAAFITYCRTLRLPPEWIPAKNWHTAFYNIPPRLVNEVIWLDNNLSTPPVSATKTSTKTKSDTSSTVVTLESKTGRLSPSDIRPAVRIVLEAADAPLTSYEILERLPVVLRDRLIAERGLPGAGSGSNFSAASLVTQALDALLPSKDAPYREYKNLVGQTFVIAGQKIKPSGTAIAVYRLSANAPKPTSETPTDTGSVILATHGIDLDDHLTTLDPADYSESTLTPPGQIADPADPNVLVVSTVDNSLTKTAEGDPVQHFATLTANTLEGQHLWVAFTSRHAMRLALGDGPNTRQNMRLSQFVDLFLKIQKTGAADIAGIVLDPLGPTPHRLSPDDMARCLNEELTLEQAKHLFPDTRLPFYTAGVEPLSRETPIKCPIRPAEHPGHEGVIHLPVPVNMNGGSYLVAFTSYETNQRGMENFAFEMCEVSLHRLCDTFLSQQETWQLSGIVLDPFEPSETILSASQILELETGVITETLQTDKILKMDSPLTMVTGQTLNEIQRILERANIQEAGAVAIIKIDMTESLIVFINPCHENTLGPLWHQIHNLVTKSPECHSGQMDIVLVEWNESWASIVADFGIKLLPPDLPAKKKRKIGFLG